MAHCGPGGAADEEDGAAAGASEAPAVLTLVSDVQT